MKARTIDALTALFIWALIITMLVLLWMYCDQIIVRLYALSAPVSRYMP